MPAQNHISGLSQKTNFYISRTSSDQLYVSSIDGLNVFNGKDLKIYRPSKNIRMMGKNIQSNFYEDDSQRVWFCTYEALHLHNPYLDTMEYFFMQNTSGSNIKSDYRVLGFINKNLIVQAGKYTFVFDPYSSEVVKRVDLDYSNYFMVEMHEYSRTVAICAADSKNFIISYLDANLDPISTTSIKLPVFSHLPVRLNEFWVGTVDGRIIRLDTETMEVHEEIEVEGAIIGLEYGPDSTIFFSTSKGLLGSIDHLTRNIDVIDYLEKFPELEPSNLCPPYIDNSKDLWFGIDGYGVVQWSLNKQKFDKWKFLKRDNFISGIHKYQEDILVTGRSMGILMVDDNGEIIKEIKRLPNGITDFTVGSGGVFKNKFIFSTLGKIYVTDLESNEVLEIPISNSPSDLCSGQDGIYCISNHKRIDVIFIDQEKYASKILIPPEQLDLKYVNSLKILEDSIAFVGINDEYAYVFNVADPSDIRKLGQLEISGKILYVSNNSSTLFVTEAGIYELNDNYEIINKISEEKDVLESSIYSALVDNKGYLWCSSNSGLILFDPQMGNSRLFTSADGVQDSEYNSNAYLKLDDGRMMFGGVKGINIFHPDSIKYSDKMVHTHVSDYKIMGESTTRFGQPNYVESITLPYAENYISFDIHGIDYADLEAVNVKYILEGYDDYWQMKDHNYVEADYKRIPAGHYTFKALATNSDGIWSNKLKEIDITILPPWWQTWWFRFSALGLTGLLIWLGFKAYYKRQLERKDLELREQRLTIEKQSALQAERNRIAAEMHDDLGGGLTTIKFISQRALRKITNPEDQKLLEKIAKHSSTLVNNMGEIIWAMNSGYDDLESLIGYMRRYAKEYLIDHDIKLIFEVEGAVEGFEMSGEKRRHIFLIMKEALHNIVKHAEASTTEILIKRHSNQLSIRIKDNGIGIGQNENKLGNGLKSMNKRATQLRGRISFANDEGGVVQLEVPIN